MLFPTLFQAAVRKCVVDHLNSPNGPLFLSDDLKIKKILAFPASLFSKFHCPMLEYIAHWPIGISNVLQWH